MRSPKSRVVLLLVLAVGACNQTRSKSSEGQPCSISEDEDPHFSCDEQKRLSCISTYDVFVERTMKREPVYLCRIRCEKEEDCLIPGDVCCPGTPYPSSGAKMACVPESRCDAMRPSRSDGGAPDGGPRPDAALRNDAAVDGGVADTAAPAVDAAADAPAGPDAARDAAPVDAPAEQDAATDA